MILKTLAFILLLYILIKFISNMFLPSPRKRSSARIIFQTIKNIRQQQQRHQERQRQTGKEHHFEEVEEAEFEDITEKDS